MKKKLPTGTSDFKTVIDNDLYYVDKTFLIDDLERFGDKVTLIPRPRRFGKTLNLSMLKYFYEKSDAPHSYLFKHMKIWQHEKMRELQGKFPVIFVTFKDVKESTWKTTRDKLIETISNEYERHRYLMDSNALSDEQKYTYRLILKKEATDADYHNSLKNLSAYLNKYHTKKPIILIDEYDSPIHAGYLNNYYKEVIEFIRGLLCGALKDNDINLERGVITGILRAAREGIFSGLNNFTVFSLLDEFACDKYGFTQDEIDQLLDYYDLNHMRDAFREWYNGYRIGTGTMYNPWSVLSCIKNKGEFATYWANTSDNELIKKLLISSDSSIKKDFEELLEGKELTNIELTDRMALPQMEGDEVAFWGLLFYSGYLTTRECYRDAKQRKLCSIMLPNHEMKLLFDTMISDIFRRGLTFSELVMVEKALQEVDLKTLNKLLSKFVHSTMSFFDIDAHEPEKSYHLFILGLLTTLSDRYIIRSNRESGFGKYDILFIPKDKNLRGFIVEFKKKDDDETMDECADSGLKQIKAKKYASEFIDHGIHTITGYGIACYKKEILVKQEELAKE